MSSFQSTMVPVTSATDGLVYCDCPKFHIRPVSVRTRSRHRKEAGMIDHLNDSLCHGQLQLNTFHNDGHPPASGSLQRQITTPTIPEEADNDYALPVHDFDDWSMDIDGEGTGGFLSDECAQTMSEEERDSDGINEEDVEGALQRLTIDPGEESAFEDEDNDESTDEELEELDDLMHDGTNEDEADSLRLHLLQLKELSGIGHRSSKANTWQ